MIGSGDDTTKYNNIGKVSLRVEVKGFTHKMMQENMSIPG